MVFKGTYEMRSLIQTALSNVSIDAGEEICQISGNIENNEVTFASLQFCASVAGKLYVVDENGNSMYLTDSDQDWPLKFQVLSTFMLPRGEVWSLRYSATCTVYNLIVVTGGSVF